MEGKLPKVVGKVLKLVGKRNGFTMPGSGHFPSRELRKLMAMLAIGSSALTISLTIELPQVVEWLFIIVAVVFNMWGAIGLIQHVNIQKLSKN
ncbi:hypothetical protein J2Y67_004699 [Neobacillus niacini]|nr:hypothetical protein [Neobacillus niacini]